MAAGACVLAANLAVRSWYVATIGSSGAIFGVIVAFGVLYPDQTVLMNFLFPIKAKYMVMIFIAIELLMTFGPNTGVSTVAHLGGAAFGYLYVKRRLPAMRAPDFGGEYRRWKMGRAKKRFQVYLRKKGGGNPWVN
jgi:membrane associated rhomboid family serine protease